MRRSAYRSASLLRSSIAQHAPGMLAFDDRPADVAEALVRLVAVSAVHVLDGGEGLLTERPVGLAGGAVLREPGLDLLDVVAGIPDAQRAVVDVGQLVGRRLPAAVIGDVPVLARGLAPAPAVGRAEAVDHGPHRRGRRQVHRVAEAVVARARPRGEVALARLVEPPEVHLLVVGPVGAARSDRGDPDPELLPALAAHREPVRRRLPGEPPAGDRRELAVGKPAVFTHAILLRPATVELLGIRRTWCRAGTPFLAGPAPLSKCRSRCDVGLRIAPRRASPRHRRD